MPDSQRLTVMGPAYTSSDNHPSTLDPPSYITNRTNKVQYKDALRTWADIIRSFAKFDRKSEARLDMVGLIIYMSCDTDSKAKLRAAETEGVLNLKGQTNDPERIQLISRILDVIAAESASEKIQREVTLLNEIHQCRRQKNETPDTFANRFDGKVAEYVHQSNDKYSSNDQQWALLMLQNANLTPDTRNSITFQLTTGAAMRDGTVSKSIIHLHSTMLTALTRAYERADTTTDLETHPDAMEELKSVIQEIKETMDTQRKEDIPTIKFSEAVSVLRQVKVTTEHTPEATTMMAKRAPEHQEENNPRKRSRIEQLKTNTKCLACGRQGHWYKDNPKCLRIMESKGQGLNNPGGYDQKKPMTGTFFRPRGQ